jgi:IS30 family transposase
MRLGARSARVIRPFAVWYYVTVGLFRRSGDALLALTLREREEISRGIVSGSSIRAIAKGLDRAVSTVSRKVARHGGHCVYRANQADIYRNLFIQARGVLKKELLGHLRSKRRIRRSQHARIFKDSRGQITDAISIRERPAEIEDRAIAGHWEGDLLSGSKNSHIATLVERHSRFTALVKVPSKDTAVVVAALTRDSQTPR